MKRIAIFASGSGSNAQRIAESFQDSSLARVSLILSNNPKAYVLERAAALGIPSRVFDRQAFYDTPEVLETLLDHGIDFIVLAGFLWLVPKNLVMAYPGAIVNIHPALLPAYGGKGMYGMNVHKAVILAGEKESGITIHHVNEQYDKGHVLLQARCAISTEETPESLAAKVQALELEHFPKVIEACIRQLD